MLIPNKINVTVFAYIIVGFIAVSLVSFIAERSEPYFIAKFVAEISPNATQQEAINDVLKMPGKEVRSKLEMVIGAIVIIKLSVNAFIMYLCSCCIVRKVSKSIHSNLSKLGALKAQVNSNET